MDKQQFLKELKELLDKYSVYIQAGVGEYSDTHGLYDQCIEIYDCKNKRIYKVDGWELAVRDIDTEE